MSEFREETVTGHNDIDGTGNGTLPPVGEEIHMPAHSIIPLLNAATLAGAIVSITLAWALVILFGVLWLWTTIRWIADTRRDINELPLDHSAHH
jgi:hypothetical protein